MLKRFEISSTIVRLIDPGDFRGYPVKSHSQFNVTYLRIICANADAAGFCLAYKMKKGFMFEKYEVVCPDK